MPSTHSLFADAALLPSGWARNVELRWDAQGTLVQVLANTCAQPGVERAAGPVLPGMPNLHSHAFQRAMAGLTEFRSSPSSAVHDSFWSWRELMYTFAQQLRPEQLEAIATWLYIEMLEAGYTSVCEFHYVHHDLDGRPYADDATLARCLLRAASTAGIGLTLLPVLYQSSGFGGIAPAQQQRRFIRSTDSMLALLSALMPDCAAQGVRLGLAPHSLRAVPMDSLRVALAGMHALDASAPIHLHIAEQTAEVDACLVFTGKRPLQWLLDSIAVGPQWCLVHATHLSGQEYKDAAKTGAVVGLCPSTEANLGDGLFDVPLWLEHQGRWGIGSDSHVCVNPAEELMLLEYGQRLRLRQRNVLASASQAQVASAMTLQAVQGGAQASGRLSGAQLAGLAAGQSASMVALDAQHLALQGLSPESMLAAHVFASHRSSAIDRVWVGGRCVVSQGRHAQHEPASRAFIDARSALLGGASFSSH